jgi:2-C-methyl-D-erythritol 4-phosphate cytidylyltransferase
MLSAIIVAGGSSRRMGFDKIFALIDGRPVVSHSIAAFENTESVSEIIIVGRPERLEELRELAAQFKKVRKVCAGGVHRQDSVANGLTELAAEAEYVAVHDAARPLVTSEQIDQVFAQSRVTGAASLASPVRDTLKQADAERCVSGSISREGVYAMETPQIFARALLAQAYEFVAASKLAITDEVSALEQLNHKVLLVPNEGWNFKITYPADLPLAEFVLKNRKSGAKG